MEYLSYLKVFGYGFVLDALYVLWFITVTNGRKVRAAFYSVALATPGLFGYIEVSKDTILAIPYLIGLFCGTLLTMSLAEKR